MFAPTTTTTIATILTESMTRGRRHELSTTSQSRIELIPTRIRKADWRTLASGGALLSSVLRTRWKRGTRMGRRKEGSGRAREVEARNGGGKRGRGGGVDRGGGGDSEAEAEEDEDEKSSEDDDESEDDEGPERRKQARFLRAVGDLAHLGFIHPTTYKAEHVLKSVY